MKTQSTSYQSAWWLKFSKDYRIVWLSSTSPQAWLRLHQTMRLIFTICMCRTIIESTWLGTEHKIFYRTFLSSFETQMLLSALLKFHYTLGLTVILTLLQPHAGKTLSLFCTVPELVVSSVPVSRFGDVFSSRCCLAPDSEAETVPRIIRLAWTALTCTSSSERSPKQDLVDANSWRGPP